MAMLILLVFFGVVEIICSGLFTGGSNPEPRQEPPFDRTSRVMMQTLLAQTFFGDDSSNSSIPYGSYTFASVSNTTGNNNGPPNPTFNFRPLLFITTHMSDAHIWYLLSCWPPAMQHSQILAKSDVMVYLTSSIEQKDDLRRHINILRDRFQHQNLTIHLKTNPGYEEGAMAAMKDAALEKWFEGYDWVVRLNPDVIIRNETFILDTMQNDHNATGILIDCDSKNPLSMINTDFFAIKPSALDKNAFMNVSMDVTVEGHFSIDIRNSIINKGNHRWVPGSQPTWHTCRAGFGREMESADVVHHHKGVDLSRPWAKIHEPNEKDLRCPIPF